MELGCGEKKIRNKHSAIFTFLAISRDPPEINSKFFTHIMGAVGDMFGENLDEIGSLVQELQGGHLKGNSHYRLESII